MNNIDFGDYCPLFTDRIYDDICTKIVIFIKQVGKDIYGRRFNVVPLLEFAIKNNITDRSIDDIYRYYVFDKLERTGYFGDGEKLETEKINDDMLKFVLI